jgi:hypothetical protein
MLKILIILLIKSNMRVRELAQQTLRDRHDTTCEQTIPV